MKSNEYRLKMVARMIRESNSLSSDPDEYFSDLKDEFLEEAIQISELNFSNIACFANLVKLKTLRFFTEKHPEIVNSVSDIFYNDHNEFAQFTIKDFSGVFEKTDLNPMRHILLNELDEFLIREEDEFTYTHSIDWKLDKNNINNMIVTIKTDIKKNQ